MRRLSPDPADHVDPLEAYDTLDRAAPTGRPWLLVNMIASVDGGISVDGRSGGLGGPADKAVFAAVRAVPDVIVVGAGTVAAERYRPPRPSDAVRAIRRQRGQAEVPRLAIVSKRLSLDPASEVFGDPSNRPLVITTADADVERLTALSAVAEVVQAGDGDHVDVAAALADLRARGTTTVLCEGGPTLNGTLFAADVIDELCLSVSPSMVGGDGPRIIHRSLAERRALDLAHVLEQDGLLFLRYVRRR